MKKLYTIVIENEGVADSKTLPITKDIYCDNYLEAFDYIREHRNDLLKEYKQSFPNFNTDFRSITSQQNICISLTFYHDDEPITALNIKGYNESYFPCGGTDSPVTYSGIFDTYSECPYNIRFHVTPYSDTYGCHVYTGEITEDLLAFMGSHTVYGKRIQNYIKFYKIKGRMKIIEGIYDPNTLERKINHLYRFTILNCVCTEILEIKSGGDISIEDYYDFMSKEGFECILKYNYITFENISYFPLLKGFKESYNEDIIYKMMEETPISEKLDFFKQYINITMKYSSGVSLTENRQYKTLSRYSRRLAIQPEELFKFIIDNFKENHILACFHILYSTLLTTEYANEQSKKANEEGVNVIYNHYKEVINIIILCTNRNRITFLEKILKYRPELKDDIFSYMEQVFYKVNKLENSTKLDLVLITKNIIEKLNEEEWANKLINTYNQNEIYEMYSYSEISFKENKVLRERLLQRKDNIPLQIAYIYCQNSNQMDLFINYAKEASLGDLLNLRQDDDDRYKKNIQICKLFIEKIEEAKYFDKSIREKMKLFGMKNIRSKEYSDKLMKNLKIKLMEMQLEK